MRKLRSIHAAAIVAAAVPIVIAPLNAHADRGGSLAAGIAGGIIGGAIVGSALAPRPYYAPAPVYVAPPPPPACYWTRGEPVWDEWRGAWVRPRVRICD